MKKIKAVDNSTKPRKHSVFLKDKLYTFYLGNGVIASFTSDRKMKQYIVDCEQELNTILQNVNSFSGVLYLEFRAVAFNLDQNQLIEIAQTFASCDKSLGYMLKDSFSVNKNHFTFSHFGQILTNLIWICRELIRYNEGRKYYAPVNKIKALNKILSAYKDDLLKIGLHSALAEKITSIAL